jgi:hypothetical protein
VRAVARPAKPARTKPFLRETGPAGLQAAGMKRLLEWGGQGFNVHGGLSAQTPGQSDCLGCLGGRMLAIEFKMPGKKPTELQWKRLREWRDAGGLAGYVTSIGELDALLEHWNDLGWVNPQFDR